MHRFWWFVGALVVAMILTLVAASGLMQEKQFCDQFEAQYVSVPEQTSTTHVPIWQIEAHCQGVQNDLFFAKLFLGVGVFLIGVGFVVRP